MCKKNSNIVWDLLFATIIFCANVLCGHTENRAWGDTPSTADRLAENKVQKNRGDAKHATQDSELEEKRRTHESILEQMLKQGGVKEKMLEALRGPELTGTIRIPISDETESETEQTTPHEKKTKPPSPKKNASTTPVIGSGREKAEKAVLPERPKIKLSEIAQEISDLLDKGELDSAEHLLNAYSKKTESLKDSGFHVQHARCLIRRHADTMMGFSGIKNISTDIEPGYDNNLVIKKINYSPLKDIQSACQRAIGFDRNITPYVVDMLYREMYEVLSTTKIPCALPDHTEIEWALILELQYNPGADPFRPVVDFAMLATIPPQYVAPHLVKDSPLGEELLEISMRWQRQYEKIRDDYEKKDFWHSTFLMDDFTNHFRLLLQLVEDGNVAEDIQEAGLAKQMKIELVSRKIESCLDLVIAHEERCKYNRNAATALTQMFFLLARTHEIDNKIYGRGTSCQ